MQPQAAQEITVASVEGITLHSTGLDVETRWHAEALPRLGETASLATTSRFCIVLENMHGTFDAAVLQLHLNAAQTDDRRPNAEIFLGSVALFGLRLASTPTATGMAGGLTAHLMFSPQARKLAATALATDVRLSLSIRPARPLPPQVEISIERIRIYLDNIGAMPSLA